MVDIYCNPNIRNKTVLILADALFGDRTSNHSAPTRWTTFGNQAPNSLLFATDPVAIDCVMCDLLDAENPGGAMARQANYLVYAQTRGLGTFERGNPWGGAGYTKINYQKVEL
jgi:hypothetical protein